MEPRRIGIPPNMNVTSKGLYFVVGFSPQAIREKIIIENNTASNIGHNLDQPLNLMVNTTKITCNSICHISTRAKAVKTPNPRSPYLM